MSNSIIKRIFLGGLELIKTIAVVVIVAFLLKTYLIQTFIVDGQSMEPNFHDGEYLLVDKLSYRISKPNRGDVIVFIPPAEPDKDYIKRIIGLPGESVEILGGSIYINGQIIEEDYIDPNDIIRTNSVKPEFKTVLKDSEFFVLGDNRNNSKDSRIIGPIPREKIVGRTFVILYPISTARIVSHLKYSALASQ